MVRPRLARIALWMAPLAILVLIVGCFASGPEIVFVSESPQGREIFLLDPVDGATRQLTVGDAVEEHPTLSPDGVRLAYVTGGTGRLVVTQLELGRDSSTARVVDGNVSGSPVWSPEGDRLAFASQKNGGTELYVAPIEGGSIVRITENEAEERLGDWSPDGEWLVFDSAGDSSGPGLWLRNVNGVNTIRLTEGNDNSPVWSPDGQRIAFVRTEDGNTDIFVVERSRNGTWRDQVRILRLTNTPETNDSPAWSPNSKSILIVSTRDGNSEIYTLTPDGSKQRRLTFNDTNDLDPVWSPNGKKIAFVSYLHGTGEIFVMDANGENQLRLTNNRSEDHSPDW